MVPRNTNNLIFSVDMEGRLFQYSIRIFHLITLNFIRWERGSCDRERGGTNVSVPRLRALVFFVSQGVTNARAVRKVAKQVYAKHFHAVFCVSPSTIQRRGEEFKERFSDGRMRHGETGMNQT